MPILTSRFTASLFTFFMVLQISSCSSEDVLDTIATTVSADPQTIAETETNQFSIISGVDSGSIVEDNDPDGDGFLEISSKLNITDSNASESAFVAEIITGLYGNLAIDADGNWTYSADNSQSAIQDLSAGSALTERLTVSSIDNTTHVITITIAGVNEKAAANQPAIITGVNSGSVVEDIYPNGNNLLEISAKLNITDNDAGEAAFIAKTSNGKYGKLTLNKAGNWSYAASNSQSVIQNLNNGQSLIDKFTVSSIDGTTKTITITIKGANEINSPAVISGTSSGSVTEDVDPDGDGLMEVAGKLNISDSDSGEAAFIAKTITGSYGKLTISSNGNWNYAASNSQGAIQNLTTGNKITDGLVISSIDGTKKTIVITINGVDEATITGTDINLSWVAPAEREDNSGLLLSEISGYKVYYGTTSGKYPNTIPVNNGSATGYTITGLNSGTYYFVVTTLDTDGRESQYSTEIVAVN